MKSDPIEAAMTEAERLFASDAAAHSDEWRQWRQFDNFKANPPWWDSGIKCVFALFGPESNFCPGSRPSNYRQVIPVLRELSRFVFDRILKVYQRQLGELWTTERAREAFADYAERELLPRIALLALGRPGVSEVRPIREDNSVPIDSPSLADEMATRKALRDACKARCKAAGVKFTNQILGKAAFPDTEDGRTIVDKWLRCKPNYNAEVDVRIRKALDQPPLTLRRNSALRDKKFPHSRTFFS